VSSWGSVVFLSVDTSVAQESCHPIYLFIVRFPTGDHLDGEALAGLTIEPQHVSRGHVSRLEAVKLAAIGHVRVPTHRKVPALPAIHRTKPKANGDVTE